MKHDGEIIRAIKRFSDSNRSSVGNLLVRRICRKCIGRLTIDNIVPFLTGLLTFDFDFDPSRRPGLINIGMDQVHVN